MNNDMSSPRQLSCPSAQPDQVGSSVIGIVHREGPDARVEMLARSVATERLVSVVPPEVRPTEVMRFAAPCAEGACSHFDNGGCQLAVRIVTRLPAVIETLRPCAIRPTCRWFRQEGAAACRRCPQVVTEPYAAPALMSEVARPTKKGAPNG